MTLYEINKAIEDAILNIYAQVDEETGEIPDDAMQALTDLRMARDEKTDVPIAPRAEGISHWLSLTELPMIAFPIPFPKCFVSKINSRQ